MPAFVWLGLLAWNAVVLLTYGWDKRRSLLAERGRGGRRVPEATLLWLLFLFAPVGAWAGMQLFRHKTRKWSFRWRAALLTVVNPLWLLVWFEVDAGSMA